MGLGFPMHPTNFAKTSESDELHKEATTKLSPARRSELGQFMTPTRIADYMASLFRNWPENVDLLDPGAGVGSLTEAFAREVAKRRGKPGGLSVRAYEIEPVLAGYLRGLFDRLEASGVKTELIERDFIREGAFALSFGDGAYSHVILNPPYKKIGASSEHRVLLRQFGIESVNLYTSFLGLAVALTKRGGEIVAIVPRSFCNGTYSRRFRKWLLNEVAIHHIHLFESRNKAFKDDNVLQENIIIHFQRGARQGHVTVSNSYDATFADYTERRLPIEEIVKSDDLERYIHIPTTGVGWAEALFTHSLEELRLAVSTGPVVDFRVREHWLREPERDAAPLLYAHHFKRGKFTWPIEHKKPNAVRMSDETKKWLLPAGWYTITKRFSSKEERRRLVANVIDPNTLPFKFFGFENHLNVLHWEKRGIEPTLARGLALFLNATVTDLHFRNFSGHTQVNATDLRSMRYPSRQLLIEFGKWAQKHPNASQDQIDAFVER